jgi:hypothetical protein
MNLALPKPRKHENTKLFEFLFRDFVISWPRCLNVCLARMSPDVARLAPS